MDDADLCADPRREPCSALYHRHAGVVLAQIGLLVGDRGLSEEILQDTMLAVWRGAESFRGESSVRSWMVAIARRQARDRLRRRRLRVVDDRVLADRPASGPGPGTWRSSGRRRP